MKTLKHIREASGGKEAYMKFFNSLLKKFGVDSPSELDGKKKKDFFNAVDKGWEGSGEKAEELLKEKLKAGKGKATIDIDFAGDKKDAKFSATKWKIKIKLTRMGADISGDKQKILAFLQSKDYNMDDRDIADLWPELMENKDDFKDDTDVEDDKGNYSGVEEDHEDDESPKKKVGDDEGNYSGVEEEAPPGMEDVVLQLKADGKTDEEAFAIAWSIYKKNRRQYYDEAKRYPVMDAGQRKKILMIAKKYSGNMQRAMKEIEKLKRDMTDNPDVMDILKKANEDLDLQGTGDTGSSKSVKEAKGDRPNQAEYYKRVDKVNAKFGIGPHGKSLGDLSSGEVKKYFAAYDKAMKEDVNENINEAKKTIQVDYDDGEDWVKKKHVKLMKKFKVKISKSWWDHGSYQATVTGDEKNILGWMKAWGYDKDYIEDMLESVAVDRRTLGFKAAMIRSEVAKKVREKSKLKKEKKKEQEVLDARYDYDGEVDTVLAAANKKIFGETAASSVSAGGIDMAPNAGKKKKPFKVIKRANY